MGWLSRFFSTHSTNIFTPPSAPTDRQIQEAENELGLKFPAAYLAFLRRRDPFPLGVCAGFYWIGSDYPHLGNIIEANRRTSESSVPAHFVAFFADGMGDMVCFDARKPNKDGEFPIVFWDHELPAGENIQAAERVAEHRESCGIVAMSFLNWLESELASHR